MSEQHPSDDKDLPLREDIRLLGRLLGDTVRAQEGEAVFDLVETIRQSSIRFRRHEDHAARRELEATLDSLSRDQTIDEGWWGPLGRWGTSVARATRTRI